MVFKTIFYEAVHLKGAEPNFAQVFMTSRTYIILTPLNPTFI